VGKFGINEVYQQKRVGKNGFMNMNDPGNEPRIGEEGPPTTFVQQK